MKAWKFIVSLFLFALLIVVGFRAVTGKWISEAGFFEGTRTSGVTLTGYWAPKVEDAMLLGIGYDEKPDQDIRFHYEDYTESASSAFRIKFRGFSDSNGTVTVTCEQPSWSQYPGITLALPGDLTKAIPSMSNLPTIDELTSIFSSVHNTNDLIDWFDSHGLSENAFWSGSTKFEAAITMIGIVNVPIKFVWTCEGITDDYFNTNQDPWYYIHINGFIKLDPSVFTLSVPNAENARITVTGIFGKADPFASFNWDSIIPNEWKNTLFSSFAANLMYLKPIDPATASVYAREGLLGLPSLPGFYIPHTDIYTKVDQGLIGQDMIHFGITTGLKKVPKERIEYDVVLPIMYMAKISYGEYELPTIPNAPQMPTLDNALQAISHAFENWEPIINTQRWQQMVENWKIDIGNLSPFEQFSIVIPDNLLNFQLPTFENVTDVTNYFVAGLPEFLNVNQTLWQQLQQSWYEPLLLSLGIILVIVFVVAGIVIWRVR